MRKYLALLLLAVLPLQGLAAAALPLCQMDRTAPAHGHPVAAVAAEAGALAGSGAPCHHDSAPASGSLSDDHCAQCLLCAALVVPAVSGLNPVTAPGFYLSFAATPRPGFVPEQPQRPPLA